MPAIILFIPLAGIFIQNIPSHKTGERISVWVTGTICIAIMAMAVTFNAPFWQELLKAVKMPFGSNLRIDLLSAVVLFTIGLVALMAVAVSTKSDSLNFTNLVLISLMGMCGVAMVRDLFTLYIFLEITGIASYVMIAIRRETNGLEGAFKYLVMSAVATVMLLSAISLIYIAVGKLEFASIAQYLSAGNPGDWSLLVKAALVLLVAAFCIKAGVVPFHGWAPGAYTAAPPAVSVLMAGIVTKAGGVYIILRMMSDVFKGARIGLPFMVLGTLSIIVGALAAIGQKDLKKMLAWSSISQIGYIILGAGVGTPLALTGALLHFFNHAVFKSLLFINSAAVDQQTGTRDMDKLGGLASRMKITGLTSVIGFLSTAGVPPFSGFWSKLLIIMALWAAKDYVYAVLALLASLLTLGYFLKMQRKVFFGKIAPGLEGTQEGGVKYTATALILSLITIAVGVLFPLAMQLLQNQGLL